MGCIVLDGYKLSSTGNRYGSLVKIAGLQPSSPARESSSLAAEGALTVGLQRRIASGWRRTALYDRVLVRDGEAPPGIVYPPLLTARRILYPW